MKLRIEKFNIINDFPHCLYAIAIDNYPLNIEDIFRIINDRDTAHMFFKKFPDHKSYPFVYLIENEI